MKKTFLGCFWILTNLWVLTTSEKSSQCWFWLYYGLGWHFSFLHVDVAFFAHFCFCIQPTEGFSTDISSIQRWVIYCQTNGGASNYTYLFRFVWYVVVFSDFLFCFQICLCVFWLVIIFSELLLCFLFFFFFFWFAFAFVIYFVLRIVIFFFFALLGHHTWFRTPLKMAVPSNSALFEGIGGNFGYSLCVLVPESRGHHQTCSWRVSVLQRLAQSLIKHTWTI